MPELPEVEILKRELKENIINKKIVETTRSDKKLKRVIPNLVVSNETILNIFRRNKYLVVETNTYWLVFHLGMTGKIIYSDSIPNKKHIHYVLKFSDGTFLYYEDARRFGSIDIFNKNSTNCYLDISLFNNLGIEPLSKEFTYEYFNSLFDNSKNIKGFLMDASYICGIGNIYACETLFLAGINPTRQVNSITEKEKQKLFQLIPDVLNKSIELGGSSISDYVHTNGKKGEMQNFYFTYGRVGQKCKICSTKIEKISQNGRSTFFCPVCQK